MNAKEMIQELLNTYGIEQEDIKTTADFYNDDSQGIWFTKRFHPLIEEAITWKLESHGWELEPYDSETMHAYN